LGADLIVVTVQTYYYYSGSNPPVTVTDNHGNVYTPGPGDGSNAYGYVQIWYCVSPTTASSGHTFTVACTQPDYITLQVSAWSGVNTACPVDFAAMNGSYPNNSNRPGSITPRYAGELIISGISNPDVNATGSPRVTSPSMTVSDYDGVHGLNMVGAQAYLVTSSTSAINPTWTWSGTSVSSDYTAIMAFIPKTATLPSFNVTNDVIVAAVGYPGGTPSSFTTPKMQALHNPSILLAFAYSNGTAPLKVTATGATETFSDCGPGLVLMNGGSIGLQAFIAYNTSTASGVSFTLSTTDSTNLSYPTLMVVEITGGATSSAIDGSSGHGYLAKANATDGTGSNNLSVGPITPTSGAADLIISYFGQYSGWSLSSETSPIVWNQLGTKDMGVYSYLQSTGGSITAYATDSTPSDPYGAILLAIKPYGR
jgi:hypothetical protein